MANPTIYSFRRSQAASGAELEGGRLRRRLELALTDLQGTPQTLLGRWSSRSWGPKT